MKIGVYISELLYEHDAVTLPGFGEFYTKYIPAKFVPEEGRIESPSKTIAFNQEKKQGDTPLIAHLVEKQNMQAEQVLKYLQDFSAEISHLLGEGKKVELENIGIFSVHEDDSISFDPDLSINYLEEASGFGTVKEPPRKTPDPEPANVVVEPTVTPIAAVSSAHASTPPEKPKKEKKREDFIMEKEKKQKLPPALRWIAFTVVPLLLIIIILALNYQYFFGGSKQHKQAETTIVTPTEELADVPAVTEEIPAEDVSASHQQQAVAEASVEPPKPEPGRNVYYIVVGSFPEETKAEQLALQLREQGATLASVFMTTGFNYHRVCYGYYYDISEAEAILGSVKETINSDAYILHR